MTTKQKVEYKKLNPQVKEIWLSALRSGKYKQGSHALHSLEGPYEGYCCLGVLAEAMGCKSEDSESSGVAHFTFRAPHYKKEVDSGLIPDNYRKHIGLDEYAQQLLVGLNDGSYDYKRKSFKQIASWIEKNL